MNHKNAMTNSFNSFSGYVIKMQKLIKHSAFITSD